MHAQDATRGSTPKNDESSKSTPRYIHKMPPEGGVPSQMGTPKNGESSKSASRSETIKGNKGISCTHKHARREMREGGAGRTVNYSKLLQNNPTALYDLVQPLLEYSQPRRQDNLINLHDDTMSQIEEASEYDYCRIDPGCWIEESKGCRAGL